MKIKVIRKGSLDYAVITDIFNKNELIQLKQEITSLKYRANRNSTGPAVDDKGNSLNFADSIWVDQVYKDRTKSSILTLNRRLFEPEITECLHKHSQFFGHILNCDVDFTLVNYYTDDTEYKTHVDRCAITALTFFSIGDFEGGDLEFTDFKERIKPIENTMVIFPGCVKHRAHPVKTKSPYSYRASMAQFLNYAR